MEKGQLAVARARLLHGMTKDGECWRYGVWQKPTKTGHRRMMVHYEVDLVHRWAYRIWVGPIPKGKQINHHCDVPDCFRPEHLYAGTQSQNTLDAVQRGRYVKNRGGAKLTVEQVHEIRSTVCPQRVFMERFGISRHTVSNIRNGRTWGGV